MVEIKVDNREIIFRVVLSGHHLATKFATIRELYDELSKGGVEKLTVIHAGGDRIVGFRWPLTESDSLFGMQVKIDVMARPGESKTSANDVLIYRSADAIVYLDDREPNQDGAAQHYHGFLRQLESLSRKPEELPLLVQIYEDAEMDRQRVFITEKSGWTPELHVTGPKNQTVLEVLTAAKIRVLENYRRYESELSKQGLEGHIKIRDRVYECVPVEPGMVPALDDDSPEVRLIEGLGGGSHSNRLTFKFLLMIALVTTIVAAVLVSVSL